MACDDVRQGSRKQSCCQKQSAGGVGSSLAQTRGPYIPLGLRALILTGHRTSHATFSSGYLYSKFLLFSTWPYCTGTTLWHCQTERSLLACIVLYCIVLYDAHTRTTNYSHAPGSSRCGQREGREGAKRLILHYQESRCNRAGITLTRESYGSYRQLSASYFYNNATSCATLSTPDINRSRSPE